MDMNLASLTNAQIYSDNAYASRLTEASSKNLLNAAAGGSDEELMSACKDFESYFIQTIFKQMRGTTELLGSSDSLFAKSSGEKIFQEMLDSELAKKAADTGGIGLASFLYKQLKREEAAQALTQEQATEPVE